MGQGVALNHYYPGNFGLPSRCVGPFTNCVVVINGGKYTEKSRYVRAVAAAARAWSVSARCIFTEAPAHATSIAQSLDLSQLDVLCVVGGDGTLHEVVNGLMRRSDADAVRRVPIGIIPGGSANCVAYDLGIPIGSPELAVAAICRGEVREVDIQHVTALPEPSATSPSSTSSTTSWPPQEGRSGDAFGCYSVQFVGWGVPTLIIKEAALFRPLGRIMYDLAIYKIILAFDLRYDVEIRMCHAKPLFGPGSDRGFVPSLSLEGGFLLVQGQNVVHAGSQVPLAPMAELDDGLIELVLVKKSPDMTRRRFVSLFSEISKASHCREDPNVWIFRCRSFAVLPRKGTRESLEGPGAVVVDGELTSAAPFQSAVIPRALPFSTSSVRKSESVSRSASAASSARSSMHSCNSL